ncbi:MAG: hypothetical protein HQL96_00780 [Magnetococcales bacterium]|nr:hypothetical protein [Magnetococcales bacterium]
MLDRQRTEWLTGLRDDVEEFLASLRMPGMPGRYLPCRRGATATGRRAGLGFACFAAKIHYTIGTWERVPAGERREWLDGIRAYQMDRPAVWLPPLPGGFADVPLLAAIVPPWESGWRRLARLLGGGTPPTPVTDAMLAETKQAIATLAQFDTTPWRPFLGYPNTPRTLENRLRRFDWTQPWSAGARSALLAVFLKTAREENLAGVLADFLDARADAATGGYCLAGHAPERGQLINGAMKVLNALDWLGRPIHYPEALLDTCLTQGPPPAGCHVVDWVYVAHRCLMQTDHRRAETQRQCLEILSLIRTHQAGDRGFSYQPGRAQNGYYGAVISRGLDEGDLHGTCLLTWAIAMILEILEENRFGWRVIRP